VAYGVRPIHYTPLGEALLWALERPAKRVERRLRDALKFYDWRSLSSRSSRGITIGDFVQVAQRTALTSRKHSCCVRLISRNYSRPEPNVQLP
jgi:hypothetical protein